MLATTIWEVEKGKVHWDDPEGWYGLAEGKGFRKGNVCTPVADIC